MLKSLAFSLFLALIFATLIIVVFKRKGPGPGNGFVFVALIEFVFIGTIGDLLLPIGPAIWNFSWIGYVLVAIFVMFLLGALLPRKKPRARIINKTDLDQEVIQDKVLNTLNASFSIFFWIMIISFLLVATGKYLYLN